MSGMMEATELQEALEVIESTNLKYFTKEMIAEFMALKGSFLAQIGRCVCVCVFVCLSVLLPTSHLLLGLRMPTSPSVQQSSSTTAW